MPESKFIIQGVDYPVPSLDSFTMDEAEILYERTGLTLDTINEDTPYTPGLLKTLLTVAYMRGNPRASRAVAEKIAGAIPQLEALEHLRSEDEEPEGEPVPLERPKTESEPLLSERSSSDSTLSGGMDSENVSELHQGNGDQAPTGTPQSVTPHTSVPVTLVS